jgi:hypothetical protein
VPYDPTSLPNRGGKWPALPGKARKPPFSCASVCCPTVFRQSTGCFGMNLPEHKFLAATPGFPGRMIEPVTFPETGRLMDLLRINAAKGGGGNRAGADRRSLSPKPIPVAQKEGAPSRKFRAPG